MAENSKLHEIILSLEGSISQNIKTCSEFTQYLFPNLKIRRWELPSSLPEVAPKQAFEIFSHLDSSSLSQHPAIQISRIRSAQDFKVSNTELKEISPGISELKVFNGIDPALRLAGPSLILRASNEEILKRLGRPWRETAERLRFPTDIRLVLTQLREVVKSAESQLNLARDHIAIMDQIFCCLFGLSSSFNDDNVRQSIRHHLSPEDARISVQFAKEAPYSVTPAVPESPIRILQ